MHSNTLTDPFDLSRFVSAQAPIYEQVVAELRAGRKQSHWMWFIFPQFDGLAMSPTAKLYAIKSIDEARALLAHSLLGPRLQECANLVLKIEGKSITAILGTPDDLKLRSSATLFGSLSPPDSVYAQILKKYYHDKPDEKTLDILEKAK